MRKSRTPGSVRGVSGNGYPYRDITDYGQGSRSFPEANPNALKCQKI